MFRDALKKILKYRCHVRGLFNPFIGFQINSIGNYIGVNELKREVPIVISMTSYRERFKDLPKTIYSLLNQTLKPDRVILWLDDESENLNTLPYEITRFIKNGLEIKFRKDIGAYTKAIYAFKECPESVIVTADDDIYYPNDWLKRLYLSYISHPEDVQVHRAHRVFISENVILPYERWVKHCGEERSGYDLFLTGVGGVLYPPNCFTKEVLREDIFLKCAPAADDIWFWVMSLVHGRKVRIVQNHYKSLICTNILRQLFCKNLYKQNQAGGNDEQLQNLLKFYGNNVLNRFSVSTDKRNQ